MKKAKILYVSQEISPYLEETEMANIARYLPQGVQERGKEIRTFMPRFGSVNERRNQLHEVIRLSGMNLIIDDTDHPLIIKVASIQSARMQVYFIDNEEYFQRKHTTRDGKGKFFKDNDARTIFFCRGVLETVKKLGWTPDIVHCHGWITSLIPLFIKTSYKDDPTYKNAKVVYSVYDHQFEEEFNDDYASKVMMEGMTDCDLELLQKPDFININLNALKFSDGLIKGSEQIHPDIEHYMDKSDRPVLSYQTPEDFIEAYSNFYDELFTEEPVFAE